MTNVRSLSTSQRIAIMLTQALSLVLDEGKPAVILVRSRVDGEDLLRRLQESGFSRLLWEERITVSRTESRGTEVIVFENDFERWSRTVSFQSHTGSLKICLFGGYAKFTLGRFGKMYVELYGLPEFDRILCASASSVILVQEGVFLDPRVLEASSAALSQAAQEFFSISRTSATEEESPAQVPTGQRTGMSESSHESQGENGFWSQASTRLDFDVESDAGLENRDSTVLEPGVVSSNVFEYTPTVQSGPPPLRETSLTPDPSFGSSAMSGEAYSELTVSSTTVEPSQGSADPRLKLRGIRFANVRVQCSDEA